MAYPGHCHPCTNPSLHPHAGAAIAATPSAAPVPIPSPSHPLASATPIPITTRIAICILIPSAWGCPSHLHAQSTPTPIFSLSPDFQFSPHHTPPPSVGPNFSHHKARVQAVGWFPLGTRKQGSRPFAAPTPPNRNGAGPKAGPAHPPPPHALAPSHSLQAVTWGSRSLPTWTGSRRPTTSMLGSGTRMVTQQVVLLSQTSEQVDPSTTTPPRLRPRQEGCTESAPSGPKKWRLCRAHSLTAVGIP